jgi:uncharacterized protein with PIN domain
MGSQSVIASWIKRIRKPYIAESIWVHVVRFIADEMLGTVAKWLRILGFDTLYARGMEDDEILEVAEKDKRVILTRDRELNERALKRNTASIYLQNANLEKDLKAILNVYPPDPKLFMTRCTICNSPLEEVPKENVKGNVPDGVYERQERFWYCPKCHKYYWEGSHWEKMREFIKGLRKDFLYED